MESIFEKLNFRPKLGSTLLGIFRILPSCESLKQFQVAASISFPGAYSEICQRL